MRPKIENTLFIDMNLYKLVFSVLFNVVLLSNKKKHYYDHYGLTIAKQFLDEPYVSLNTIAVSHIG